jgi:hypothetical protein
MNSNQIMWYHFGSQAYKRDDPEESNIFPEGSEAREYWNMGWKDMSLFEDQLIIPTFGEEYILDG